MRERGGEAKGAGWGERRLRDLRNVNALGALAFGGLAVLVPPVAPVAAVLAGKNTIEAGGYEAGRRMVKKKREGKSKTGR